MKGSKKKGKCIPMALVSLVLSKKTDEKGIITRYLGWPYCSKGQGGGLFYTRMFMEKMVVKKRIKGSADL
jgi:hypothetical protein